MRISMGAGLINTLIERTIRIYQLRLQEPTLRYMVCSDDVDRIELGDPREAENKDELWGLVDTLDELCAWERVTDVVDDHVLWPPPEHPVEMCWLHVTPDYVWWRVRPKYATYDLETRTLSRETLRELLERLGETNPITDEGQYHITDEGQQ